MAIRTNINATEGRFYITFTCYRWLSLFDVTKAYDLIYKQFDILKSEGHAIVGYVIMPNHVHAIIDFAEGVGNINRRVGTMKRFIAYEIVSRLVELKQTDILIALQNSVNAADKKKGKLHEVFESSFDAKQCLTDSFTLQKLNYIHKNPCTGKWQLCIYPEDYLHSSAAYYNTGMKGIYEVKHYLDVRL